MTLYELMNGLDAAAKASRDMKGGGLYRHLFEAARAVERACEAAGELGLDIEIELEFVPDTGPPN